MPPLSPDSYSVSSSIISKNEMVLAVPGPSSNHLPRCSSTESKRKSCNNTPSRNTHRASYSVLVAASRRQQQPHQQRLKLHLRRVMSSLVLILLFVTISIDNFGGTDTGTVTIGSDGYNFGFGFGIGVHAESSSRPSSLSAAATTRAAGILHSRRTNTPSSARRDAFIRPSHPYTRPGHSNHQQIHEKTKRLILSSSTTSPSLSMISSSSLSINTNGSQQQRWMRSISPQIPSRISAVTFSTSRRTSSYLSSTTALQMVASTKSGGVPILTVEQFQKDVLLQSPSVIDGHYDDVQEEENDQEQEGEKLTSNNNHPILVLYSAPWCGPCRLTNPIIQQIVQERTTSDSINNNKPTLRIYEVCTDDLPTIAESAGVVSIPTIQLYYGGVCYETIVGCVTKNVLSSAIDKMLDDLGLLDDDGDENHDGDKDKDNK